MPAEFLHNHPALPELLRIIDNETASAGQTDDEGRYWPRYIYPHE